MKKINKEEWPHQMQTVPLDAELRDATRWDQTLQLVEHVQALLAEKTCRYCGAYGKPEIKPGSWVHKKDRTGEVLSNPQTCQAAVIWAAELVEEQ